MDHDVLLQADILNVPVVRPTMTETTALGAAYAAGLATGYWTGTEELIGNWGIDRVFTPTMPEPKRAALYASWNKAVKRSFDWAD